VQITEFGTLIWETREGVGSFRCRLFLALKLVGFLLVYDTIMRFIEHNPRVLKNK